jgi:hypothetical protein
MGYRHSKKECSRCIEYMEYLRFSLRRRCQPGRSELEEELHGYKRMKRRHTVGHESILDTECVFGGNLLLWGRGGDVQVGLSVLRRVALLPPPNKRIHYHHYNM